MASVGEFTQGSVILPETKMLSGQWERSVLAVEPETVYQEALLQHKRGDFAGAERGYRTILAENPNHAGANHFLGMLYFTRHQYQEALAYLKKALDFCSTRAVYYNNFGVVLKAQNQLDDAENAFRKAIALAPNYADAHSNLGMIRLIRNDLKQAEQELETALKLNPNHTDAKTHLGELRFRQGEMFAAQERFNDAARSFRQAASLPGGQELWHWKPLNFCPSIFPDEPSIEQYWNHLNEKLDDALSRNIPIRWENLPRNGFTPSFNLPHFGKCCREVKEKFSALFENAFGYDRPTLQQTRRNHRSIRIGFVVTAGHHRGFLRVYKYLLEQIDTKRFEIFFFCPKTILEHCRKAIHNNGIHFIGLSERFDEMVKMLLAASCDLLYHWKVGGGTLDYFLAMAKAAPIQCTSYGTHGTSGVAAVDYYLSTSQIELPEADRHYTEQLIRFDSYPTCHPIDPVIEPANRVELHLPEQGAIYFCPHRLPKYHPCMDEYFRLILEYDPKGTLVLCSGRKKPLAGLFAKRLQRSLGDELFRRVRLIPSLPLDVYKKHLSAATCVLDSPIYAGDLTTHDALNQGVPVVTHEGKLLVQRYTTGIYRTLQLDSLITQNAGEYARLAVRFGTDSDYREYVRQQILERNKTVFETKNTVRDYENFFERVCS